jgi:tetratricopeptide (TPR) repeat protein
LDIQLKRLITENKDLQKLQTQINSLQSLQKIKQVENTELRLQLEGLESQLKERQSEKKEKIVIPLISELQNQIASLQNLKETKISENNRLKEQIKNLETKLQTTIQSVKKEKDERLSPLPTKADERLIPLPTPTKSFSQNLSLDADSYFERGITLFDKDDFDEAINELNVAIGLNRSHAEAYYYRGRAYDEKGNFNQAVEDYTKTIELNEKNSSAYYSRGVIYFYELNDADSATNDFKEVLKFDPNNKFAKEFLADLIKKNKPLAKIKGFVMNAGAVISFIAFHYFVTSYSFFLIKNNILDLESTGAIIYFMMAIPIVFVILMFIYSSSVIRKSLSFIGILLFIYFVYCIFFMPNYLQTAKNCLEKKNLDCAIENYTQTIYWYPSYWFTDKNEAYTQRGIAYNAKANYDEAIGDLSKSIWLSPKEFYSYYVRGVANHNKGNYDLAIIDYSKAIGLNPDYAVAHYHRGKVYAQKENYKQAMVDFNRAIILEPNNSSFYKARGFAHLKLKDNQQKVSEEIISDYSKAIELSPKDADAYFNRGYLYFQLKDYDKAIKDISKAIEFNPTDSGYFNIRGFSYHNKQNYDQAINDYQKALEISPNYENAKKNLKLAIQAREK